MTSHVMLLIVVINISKVIKISADNGGNSMTEKAYKASYVGLQPSAKFHSDNRPVAAVISMKIFNDVSLTSMLGYGVTAEA